MFVFAGGKNTTVAETHSQMVKGHPQKTHCGMITFLTRLKTASEIETIIRDAKQKIVLVSPYLKLSPNIVERLQDADQTGIRITLIYGKEKLPKDQQKILGKLNNLDVYFSEHLHAKCYFNEERLVITSMNLHSYSEQHNREMGVLFTNDEPIYQEAVKETESIQKAATKENWTLQRIGSMAKSIGSVLATGARAVADFAAPNQLENGYCIRCGNQIAYNLDRPFCEKCYKTWAKWGDDTYKEKICHTCGKPHATSRAKPQCYSCYKQA